jgi:hypothetical protein
MRISFKHCFASSAEIWSRSVLESNQVYNDTRETYACYLARSTCIRPLLFLAVDSGSQSVDRQEPVGTGSKISNTVHHKHKFSVHSRHV